MSVKLRRIRKAGDLKTLQKKLWQAVLAAEDLLLSSGQTPEVQIRAIHALVQAGTAYHKLLESLEIEKRLGELEVLLQGD